MITGSSSGVGEQLAGIVYKHNAKVYVAARSEEKATKAIQRLKSTYPNSTGELIFLKLDLNDLSTIKNTADTFLAAETRLDVLWLNAGVMAPPQGSKTAQGYDLQLGTNNIAHLLLVRYLHPVLKDTAKTAPPNSVRVLWVASSASLFAPKNGVDLDNMDYKKEEHPFSKYMRSKAMNLLHGAEYARRAKEDGIISLVGQV